MGFYPTTENPSAMMRENHKTKSSEYIVKCQDELYIVSTTPEEFLHMLKDKYMNNIYLQDNYPHDPGGTNICQRKKYLEKLGVYENVNILLNDQLSQHLHISLEIIKLLIIKANLNMIHNKNAST